MLHQFVLGRQFLGQAVESTGNLRPQFVTDLFIAGLRFLSVFYSPGRRRPLPWSSLDGSRVEAR